jgi:hypothetical protein
MLRLQLPADEWVLGLTIARQVGRRRGAPVARAAARPLDRTRGSSDP